MSSDLDVEDFYIDLKLYRIIRIHIYKDDSHISGLEVEFDNLESGVEGYESVTHLFGTRDLKHGYTYSSTYYDSVDDIIQLSVWMNDGQVSEEARLVGI